jgi:hypothetical protein
MGTFYSFSASEGFQYSRTIREEKIEGPSLGQIHATRSSIGPQAHHEAHHSPIFIMRNFYHQLHHRLIGKSFI